MGGRGMSEANKEGMFLLGIVIFAALVVLFIPR